MMKEFSGNSQSVGKKGNLRTGKITHLNQRPPNSNLGKRKLAHNGLISPKK
jgi:hypothetical protein